MDRNQKKTAQILLVDDERAYRETLGQILVQEHYLVCTAATGTSAINIAREFAPDVLVVDWMLRDVDGVQVAQQVRSENPRLKTIFITSYGDARLKQQIRTVPSAQILCKPFSLDEFLEAIRVAVYQDAP
jgi:two-component system OmpR family response regulator